MVEGLRVAIFPSEFDDALTIAFDFLLMGILGGA
jgi:hypothetical protein